MIVKKKIVYHNVEDEQLIQTQSKHVVANLKL